MIGMGAKDAEADLEMPSTDKRWDVFVNPSQLVEQYSIVLNKGRKKAQYVRLVLRHNCQPCCQVGVCYFKKVENYLKKTSFL